MYLIECDACRAFATMLPALTGRFLQPKLPQKPKEGTSPGQQPGTLMLLKN